MGETYPEYENVWTIEWRESDADSYIVIHSSPNKPDLDTHYLEHYYKNGQVRITSPNCTKGTPQ